MLKSNLDLLATAPGGVSRLRELILTLAVKGRLVSQDPNEEPASELLKKIRAEKDRLTSDGKIKKDKPLVQITEDEKPFDLPEGWMWVPLHHVGYTQTGTTPDKKKPHMYGGDVPFIKPGDIYPNHVDYDNEALSQEGMNDSGRIAPAGSLLMVCIGTLGKSNLISKDCSFNQQINSVTPLGCVPEYLKLYCRSPYFQGEVWARSSSTTIAILNKGKWEAIPFALPPIDEQTRIVARVEELMRLCDALEVKGQLEATQHAQLVRTLLGTLTDSETPEELAENWQRIAAHFDLLLDRPEAVDALEQTLLQLAVRGLLVPQDPKDEPASELLKKIRAEKDKQIAEGKIKPDKPLPPIAEDDQPFELPLGWEWVRFGAIVGIERGGSPRPIEAFLTDDADGFNWIKIGDTEIGGKYITSVRQRIKREGLVKTRMVFPGDFLLTNSMSFGRPYITKIQGCIHDGWLRISPPSSLDKDYLYDLLSSDFLRSVFAEAAAGAVVLNLNADKVRGVLIPLPPLAEQSRMVSKVEQLRRLCADLRQCLTSARERQSQLAQSLVEQQSDLRQSSSNLYA